MKKLFRPLAWGGPIIARLVYGSASEIKRRKIHKQRVKNQIKNLFGGDHFPADDHKYFADKFYFFFFCLLFLKVNEKHDLLNAVVSVS